MAYKIASPRILSRLASSRRRQSWHVADTSEEYNEGDEVGELRGGKESGLKHPI